MRFRRVLVTVLALLPVLVAAVWLILKYSPEVTLSFTEAQLQEQLNPRFPASKCVLGACVELASPKLSLSAGTDRVGIETTFVASFGNRKMPGTAKFSGRPHYESGSGIFYLHDVQVSEFSMAGNAPDFNEVVRVRGPGIVAAIMNRFPLYSVQNHPQYGSIAKLALKSVNVSEGKLHVVFANPLLPFGKELGSYSK